MGDLEIIFRELMPNLFPFLAASFVGAMASGILAAVGLEALGLGSPTRTYARNDDLLVALLRRGHQQLVVVVRPADPTGRVDIHLPLSDRWWSRQVGQPTIEAEPVMPDAVLSIRDLRVYFNIRAGTVRAVDGVDLDIAEGEKLGLVGESGSGKTTTALAIMRMIKPPGEIAGGTIQLDGRDLVGLSEPEMRAVRGNDVAMVPQAAMNALNPVRRIRSQMIDGLRDHGVNESRERTEERLTTLVAQVGLNANVLNLFPHELSGGMKQRVTIAMAICHKPRLDPRRRAHQRARRCGPTPSHGNARRGAERDRRRGDPGRT